MRLIGVAIAAVIYPCLIMHLAIQLAVDEILRTVPLPTLLLVIYGNFRTYEHAIMLGFLPILLSTS